MATTTDTQWRLPMLHVSNAALLLGLLLYGIQHWGKLPAQVPIHFGFSGEPDRFTDKGFELALVLFALPVFISLIVYVGYPLINRAVNNPELMKKATRKVWMQTPKNKRHLLLFHMRETLALIVMAALVLFWSINTALVGVALGLVPVLAPERVLPFLAALIVLIIWRAVQFHRLGKRLAGE
jgi:uncharacterized membrane protein